MDKNIKLVVATNNAGKMREFDQMLKPYFSTIMTLKQAGIDVDVQETGQTFEQNAVLKATQIKGMLSHEYAVIADDSGLCVDYLNDAPGVYSARFSGVHGDDEANNTKLLQLLEHCTQRSARFVCAVALAFDKTVVTAQGEVEGRILHQPQGQNGFGYDCLFFCDSLGIGFGQATAQQKNSVSHRFKALQRLIAKL